MGTRRQPARFEAALSVFLSNSVRHPPERRIEYLAGVNRLLDGLADRHHANIDPPLPRQSNSGDEARPEIDHASIDSRHVGVRVEHHRPPARCW